MLLRATTAFMYGSFLLLPSLCEGAITTITFSEYPVGTNVNNSEYKTVGVYFSPSALSASGDGDIVTDSRFTTSPVLDMGTIPGSFDVYFKTLDYQTRAVHSVSFDIGPFRGPNEAIIYWKKGTLTIGSMSNKGSGIEHIATNSSDDINSISITYNRSLLSDQPRWHLDNFTSDALDGGTCQTTSASSTAGPTCPPPKCGDTDKDSIIAEYKKSYGKDKLGKDLKIFDINIDHDGIKNSIKPESYFVPTCDMFSNRLRTGYYSFLELKNGLGDCSPLHSWALLANALIDTGSSGRGLDAWIDAIIKNKLKYKGKVIVTKTKPNLNSGYRSPARQLSSCVNSQAYGSRHMFGDAVDLAVNSTEKNAIKARDERKAIVLFWYNLAKKMASGDWFEDAANYPCTTAKSQISKQWKCAHVDWRGEADRFRPTAASKAGMVALAAALSVSAPALSSDSTNMRELNKLAASSNWEDRAEAYSRLSLNNRERDNENRPVLDGGQSIGQDKKKLLLDLFRRELPPNVNSGEDEDNYFYGLMVTVSLYAQPEAAPLLLSPYVLSRGRAAWRAAARMGDKGLPVLLKKLKNKQDPLYGDYIGVACTMQQLGTLKNQENVDKVNLAIVEGTKSPDDVDRHLATDCLKWTPKELAEPILMKEQISDQNESVREVAKRTLGIIRSNKTIKELRDSY